MKFLADMGVSLTTVSVLKTLGHDIYHLREKGLQAMPDSEIFQRAKLEERILLTFDLDFADILAASHQNTPSVILFRLNNQTPQSVNPRLLQVLKEASQKLQEGSIIIVEDNRFRIRRLPIIQ